MTQHALPGLQAPPKLTDRQAEALRIIREHGPIASRELGAFVHEWRGRHGFGSPCEFCRKAGDELGRSLRKKGLARQRLRTVGARRAGWYALTPEGKPLRQPEAEEFEWPEGF